MNKPERIYLTETDAIEAFAPETRSEPRRTVREGPAEQLDVFQSEGFAESTVFADSKVFAESKVFADPDVFAESVRSSVPLRTRRRVHPASLVVVVGIAAVFAVVVMQQSNAPESTPVASVASSTVDGTQAPPASPPVTSDQPSPLSTLPAPVVELSAPSATLPENPPPLATPPDPPAKVEPPSRSESSPAVATPAPPPPRMPLPLSQDPARLAAGVTTPAPPSRGSVDVPSAPRPTPPARPLSSSAEPPAATTASSAAASSPPSSPPPSVAATPSPSPPAMPPPSAAATLPAPAAASAAVATPPASAAAAPAAAAAVIDTNTSGIQNALARYRQAFSSLNANAAREVWPTVNERTLSRAFDRLEQQELSFEGCQISINDARAEALCNGSARYVPRVGSRTARVERRQWHFSLVKVRDEWLIGAVDAR